MWLDERILELDRQSTALYRQGRYREAAAALEQIVELIEANRSPRHHSLGSPFNNLAMVYEQDGRDREAEHTFLRSLQVMAGSQRPYEIARTHHSLGKLYARALRYDAAKDQLWAARRALDPVRPSHPDLAGFIDADLADQLLRQERFSEALPLLRESLQALKTAFGQTSQPVASAQNNLAQTLMSLRHSREAEMLFRAALTTMRSTVLPQDERVRDTVDNLATLYAQTGRLAEEIQLRADYVSRCTGAVPDSHPILSDMLLELARAYRTGGDYGSAEAPTSGSWQAVPMTIGPSWVSTDWP
jgi:tetratricopeptide (TPR) repeat protein